jgi:lipopolysaccharide export system protein LptA
MINLFTRYMRDAGLIVISVVTFICAPSLVLAQLGSVPIFGQSENRDPIAISAEDGIEWDRDNRVYKARGNAQASQGGFFVIANEINAFYREGEGNGNKIWKVLAKGSVFAKSADDEIFGDQAEYFIDEERLLLTGTNIVLNSPRGRLTSNRQIEYDSKKQIAVAEGDAIVIQNENRVMADKLTAKLAKGAGPDGKQEINFIIAEGNVRIASGEGFAQAEKAEYDVIREYATLCGNVRLTQGENQLNGDYAEVDMKKGTSRILAGSPLCGDTEPGKKKKRVYVLIDPSSKKAPKISE